MVFSTSKVIDWEFGTNLFGGSREAAEEMLEQLCRELPRVKERLTAAWEAQDTKLLQEITHKLYGGVCYCPTPRLKIAANNFEKNLVADDKASGLKDSYFELCQEIEAVLDSVN